MGSEMCIRDSCATASSLTQCQLPVPCPEPETLHYSLLQNLARTGCVCEWPIVLSVLIKCARATVHALLCNQCRHLHDGHKKCCFLYRECNIHRFRWRSVAQLAREDAQCWRGQGFDPRKGRSIFFITAKTTKGSVMRLTNRGTRQC